MMGLENIIRKVVFDAIVINNKWYAQTYFLGDENNTNIVMAYSAIPINRNDYNYVGLILNRKMYVHKTVNS